MLDNTIAAARANNRASCCPGRFTILVPTPFLFCVKTRRSTPLTRKGAIRVAMEQRLQVAATDGVPGLIVRAGDFFGPTTTSNSVFFSRDG